jgi:hypothetical protein
LVRLVDPEEIAAAREPVDGEIADDPISDQADEHDDADDGEPSP